MGTYEGIMPYNFKNLLKMMRLQKALGFGKVERRNYYLDWKRTH